jgi:hypothetical protein
MRALLCLGKLIKLELNDGRKLSLKNRWLAWDGRNLHVCTITGTTKASLPSAITAKHRKFHGQNPKGEPFVAECPTKTGAAKLLGLVKALVYTVPRKINSPEKNPYQWHHAFGDTGHKGGDSYPEKVMPALLKDAKGNLFFKRRPGNIYKIDQWIRG